MGGFFVVLIMKEQEQSTSTPEQGIHRNGIDFRGLVEQPVEVDMGEILSRDDISSSLRPFLYSAEYRTVYPGVITSALGTLVSEYNCAFIPLVAKNREWETDYQFATSESSTPVNYFVQIDMVGLPDGFLRAVPQLDEAEVCEVLRRNIFEIENSMAMYGLLQGIFSRDGERSIFGNRFRASLDAIRQKYQMPIALLAVTDQKHQSLREIEFGKQEGEALTDEEIKGISGFDRLFGPEDFLQYLEQSGGECGYLLYVRSSDPVSKLKKPDIKVDIPLLEDPRTRRIVKANAITFNIDNPSLDSMSRGRINDTKAYLSPMGMGFEISDQINLDSPDFKEYLIHQGIDPNEVFGGQVSLRAKPFQGTYGCYGHFRGKLTNREFRSELRKNLRLRGRYVIQPELPIPTVRNSRNGAEFVFIDRNFMFTDGINRSVFLGGFRSLMPADSTEARNGRVHGSKLNVHAQITDI